MQRGGECGGTGFKRTIIDSTNTCCKRIGRAVLSDESDAYPASFVDMTENAFLREHTAWIINKKQATAE